MRCDENKDPMLFALNRKRQDGMNIFSFKTFVFAKVRKYSRGYTVYSSHIEDPKYDIDNPKTFKRLRDASLYVYGQFDVFIGMKENNEERRHTI